jgi:hypothetical protein
MNKAKIREMTEDETPLLVRWLYKHRETNLVDLEPFRKNQVKVFVAEDEFGVICFIPIRAIYLFDALAPNPGAGEAELAMAFKAMQEYLIEDAKEHNVSKALVQPSDAKFSKFIQKHFNYSPIVRETLEFNFNEVQEPAKCASSQ